jgi:2-keto-4-pentenoate hydratase
MTSGLDPRVLQGTESMIALQRRRLDSGTERLGWKAAFGSPTGLASLGLDRPLVGFLTQDRRLEPGSEADVSGWTRPMFEAEVAVHIGRDLPLRPEADEVEAAIAGLSAAIELADVDPPPSDVVEILSGNIFHRYVVVGTPQAERRDLAGVSATVSRGGTLSAGSTEVAATDDPEALTGRLLTVVTSMAHTLAEVGEQLLAGDVIIAGAVVPPFAVEPGDHLTVELAGIGTVKVRIR